MVSIGFGLLRPPDIYQVLYCNLGAASRVAHQQLESRQPHLTRSHPFLSDHQ